MSDGVDEHGAVAGVVTSLTLDANGQYQFRTDGNQGECTNALETGIGVWFDCNFSIGRVHSVVRLLIVICEYDLGIQSMNQMIVVGMQ